MKRESKSWPQPNSRAVVPLFPLICAFCLGAVLSASAEDHAQAHAEALFQRKLLLGLMFVLIVVAAVYIYSRKKV